MRTSVAAALAALALAAPATLAAGGDPAASTAGASSVTATTAVIAGTVNPNGSATTYQVQYGTTAAYGSGTAPGAAGSGTTAMAISVPIGGLAPDTTYHYRVVATNANGSANGSDAAFATAKAPPSVAPSAPVSIAATSALAAASVNPNGIETSVTFQYGHTTAYGSTTAALAAGAGTADVHVQATLANLLPGTAYHYRAIATSADGTTHGADTAFTTAKAAPGATTGAPSVVQSAGARLTSSSVQLDGAINPPATSTTWWFEYGPSAAYGSQSIPQTLSGLGPHAVNVRLAGLAAATAFHYRLELQSAGGRYVGPDGTFTTKALVRTRPAGLTLAASASARARSVAISASGRLASTLPGACNGVVEIAVMRGPDTISLRAVALRGDCTYAERISLRRRRTGRRVTVLAHFTGNATLLGAAARRVAVAIG